MNPIKPDVPEPHIKDDDKNNDNPDPHKKEEKKDEPVTPENRNSSKKYLWIILGIFGLAALVVMFIYRTRIMIKVFGWEKYVEKFHSNWSDWQKRFFYRKIFGYKKYIEKFSNDWWELYTGPYLKGLKVESEEMKYVVSLISEIFFKDQELYYENVYDYASGIVEHATEYVMFWCNRLARTEKIVESVELSQDGHFLVKDKKTRDTVTFKYLVLFFKLASELPASNFHDNLLTFDTYFHDFDGQPYNFFKLFLYLDNPDDSFISTLLTSNSKIKLKAEGAIIELQSLVSRLDSTKFKGSVKERLTLNCNKLLSYFKCLLLNEAFKKHDEGKSKFLTYDEANDILKVVKSKINSGNNILQINDGQANNE